MWLLRSTCGITPLFITTEAVITDKPEPKGAMTPSAAGGDMDF